MGAEWTNWLEGWDKARSLAGYEDDTELPIFDVADSDMAQLALEKLQNEAFESEMSPEEAVAIAEDRDSFAVKYYDPYIDEFEAELERSGRL